MAEYTMPLRWGIIATGGIAQQVASDVIEHSRHEARLVAVASRHLSSAQAFAARFRVRDAYGTHQEIVSVPDLEVGYVATPHTSHLETASLLLNAGIPVLCEKPLTTNPEDTRALIELARKKQTFLMEAVWMRCNPLIRRAAELVRSGALGDITFVRAAFSVSFDVPTSHRLRDPGLGGGAILDLGLYPAHFVELMLGRPARVFARGELDAETGVDASTTALFEFPAANGRPAAQGVAYCSIEAQANQFAEVVGTTGRLEIDGFLNPTQMRLVRPSGESEQFGTSNQGNGYGHEIAEITRCVRAGKIESDLVSWDATINVADMLSAWRAAIDDSTGLVDI